MSKSDILSFFYTNSENLTPLRIVLVMAMALVLGAVIWLTYRFTCEATIYSRAFAVSNLLMVLLTTVVMLMISTNIVISLGMVGALSIVRFRTAVKDPRDTIYLFWSMVAGLSTGSQNLVLAVVSTLVISVVLIVIHLAPRRKTRFTLIVRAEGTGLADVQKALENDAVRVKLQAMNKSRGAGEYVFLLAGTQAACEQSAARLEALDGVGGVNLIAPEEGAL